VFVTVGGKQNQGKLILLLACLPNLILC
jgi:hypothetical protein